MAAKTRRLNLQMHIMCDFVRAMLRAKEAGYDDLEILMPGLEDGRFLRRKRSKVLIPQAVREWVIKTYQDLLDQGLTSRQITYRTGITKAIAFRMAGVEDERDLEIIRLRNEGATLQEIGRRFNVSRQRIQQIIPGRLKKGNSKEEKCQKIRSNYISSSR